MKEATKRAIKYSKGMGQAVADRTINRKKYTMLKKSQLVTITLPFIESMSLQKEIEDYCQRKGLVISDHKIIKQDQSSLTLTLTVTEKFKMEEWKDVALRVAKGNTMLSPKDAESEFQMMHRHLLHGTLLLSGRHLQHGDETQPMRNMEIFTNCATSAMSFLTFYLLLNGSGVGRSMDDAMIVVDYKYLPIIAPVIDLKHADVLSGEIENAVNRSRAEELYQNKKIHFFDVPDSREGWAKAIEKLEIMAFQKKFKDDVLIIDFSQVRPRGAPIKGMQNRPASGPGPLMLAIENIAKLREANMEPWRSTMFVDHYLAECVLVGGARRAARMATKSWREKSVLDFITIKRSGLLWSSNNSVTVDNEFWSYVKNKNNQTELALHANDVFNKLCYSAYHDGTGEPGIINQDKLTQKDQGLENYLDGMFAESHKYKMESETFELTKILAQKCLSLPYHQITNPCGEISLNLLGGYCVIGDVVPYHAQSDEEAIEAFKIATRALMRVNLMDSMYKKEVLRTNRIGVGLTGFHEWAWKRFGLSWSDIIDESKSQQMWQMLSLFKRVVVNEAKEYAIVLNQQIPHTNTTIKPAGTTSKLFGLTEGAHLPSMREYIRWVQFRYDDPILNEYQSKGYPVKKLKTYAGTTIVGFPTQPEICKLGMKEKLKTASEATPEEQYQYLRLLEKYWIKGVESDGHSPLEESGNQVSYTLKYNPAEISYERFVKTVLDGQSTIRCCAVMPFGESSAYEYQPEEAITDIDYKALLKKIHISENDSEDISQEHIDCITSACPIDFKKL